MFTERRGVWIDDSPCAQGYAIKTGPRGLVGYVTGSASGEPTVALLPGVRLSFDEI